MAWQRWRGVVRGSVALGQVDASAVASQRESLQCWEQGQQRLVFLVHARVSESEVSGVGW